MNVLVSWIGTTDLKACDGDVAAGVGPIAQAVAGNAYDEVVLVSDHGEGRTRAYAAWLSGRGAPRVIERNERLSGPTQFREIHDAAVRAVEDVLGRHGKDARLTFHISPGTPAMATTWVLLAKSRYRADLIESSKAHGVKPVEVPFEISAEFLPELLRSTDAKLEELSAGLPPAAPEFDSIICRCAPMRRLVTRARRVAQRSVPVLIEGESGTGKELLARAIHAGGLRGAKPFVAVNCGAIPPSLIESELFGHEKGAFTGATSPRLGHFRAASGGTLFLDEIGELPPDAQVKLLRVLQQGEVVAVGASVATAVDVRIIAATHRNLLQDVASGKFRADLFYRLAVAILRVPPLRERQGDLGLLIDRLLEQVNGESAGDPGFKRKTLSASARTLLLRHGWPGNVRELLNTLRRAAIWSTSPAIQAEDVREALLPLHTPEASVLDRALGDGLDLQDLLASVARHYLERALDAAHGNKTQAANLVGLPSHQTLSNWMKRYGVK